MQHIINTILLIIFLFVIENDLLMCKLPINPPDVYNYPAYSRTKINQIYTPKTPLKKLKQLFCKCTGDTLKSIKKIKYVTTQRMINNENYLFFKVYYKKYMPRCAISPLYLIVPEEITKHSSYALTLGLQKIHFIKRNKKDTCYIIGGTQQYYLTSEFILYTINYNQINKIFETKQLIYSYNSSDCISYEKGELKIENIDINNDGYMDLRFSGIENHYCHGDGNGEVLGFEERKKPLKRKFVEYNYIYNPQKNNWYYITKKKLIKTAGKHNAN